MARAHAVRPGPGQESVWDYPRPPRLEPVRHRIRVELGGVTIADSRRAFRVLETSHPPVYYLPPADVAQQHLRPAGKRSFCEWKGAAHYFDVTVGDRTAHAAAWCYPAPTAGFEEIAGALAFYAQHMDACYVNDELVRPQDGGFYGGWITQNVVGPFKGGRGSASW